ncbi:MAG: type IV toxin-antitoxin system AbiEi family antitoxin domain-containing protein [Anaerolineae bacterium]|nr:type IV toxin-antitoxin system AbiEi family antitoxin domain-containing protein [Anaerolineae bacterium]
MKPLSPSQKKALAHFRQHQGILRTSQVLDLDIHPRTLYALRDAGLVKPLARGLYRLTELPPLTEPDLVIVSQIIPDGVICLISALAFHEMTTQIPHVVDVALKQGSRRPRLQHPPLRYFWFSDASWQEGTASYRIDGVPVRITNPAKTVADSFKFRRKLGSGIAIEALENYYRRQEFDVSVLMHYARLCRIENVIQPYLEALL